MKTLNQDPSIKQADVVQPPAGTAETAKTPRGRRGLRASAAALAFAVAGTGAALLVNRGGDTPKPSERQLTATADPNTATAPLEALPTPAVPVESPAVVVPKAEVKTAEAPDYKSMSPDQIRNLFTQFTPGEKGVALIGEQSNLFLPSNLNFKKAPSADAEAGHGDGGEQGMGLIHAWVIDRGDQGMWFAGNTGSEDGKTTDVVFFQAGPGIMQVSHEGAQSPFDAANLETQNVTVSSVSEYSAEASFVSTPADPYSDPARGNQAPVGQVMSSGSLS